MRNDGGRRKLWSALGLLWVIGFSVSAQAIEVRTNAVWWQYEEISSDPRYQATPFHSKATTVTLEITTVEEVEINHEWRWRSEISSIVPTVQAIERWHNPFDQHNDLRIAQLEGQLTLLRKFDGFNLGVWSALRWHQQARQHFSQFSVPTADPLVTETVRTAWLGGTLSGQWWRILAGVPVWVRTTNSSITNTFSKRAGFRAGVELHWPFTVWLGNTVQLHGGYHYQQLGGDAQITALWPKNRFQTLSLGMSAEW